MSESTPARHPSSPFSSRLVRAAAVAPARRVRMNVVGKQPSRWPSQPLVRVKGWRAGQRRCRCSGSDWRCYPSQRCNAPFLQVNILRGWLYQPHRANSLGAARHALSSATNSAIERAPMAQADARASRACKLPARRFVAPLISFFSLPRPSHLSQFFTHLDFGISRLHDWLRHIAWFCRTRAEPWCAAISAVSGVFGDNRAFPRMH